MRAGDVFCLSLPSLSLLVTIIYNLCTLGCFFGTSFLYILLVFTYQKKKISFVELLSRVMSKVC